MTTNKAIIWAAIILAVSHVWNGYLMDLDVILKCDTYGTTCIVGAEQDR